MTEIQTSTLRYFYLAISKYLPELRKLREKATKKEIKEKLDETIEIYEDISKKVSRHRLNHGDPNQSYEGEPWEIDIEIPPQIIEDLSRLTHRMLLDWQKRIKNLKEKGYKTEDDLKELNKLKNLEWPLKAQHTNMSSFIGINAEKGPLEFPGENEEIETPHLQNSEKLNEGIFPNLLIDKLPKDVAVLCSEFNFNYINLKPNASMLLLRRILPLAIVRKFQKDGKEQKLKNTDNEFLDTQALLGKAENQSSEKRIYKEINSYKALVDSSQHSYSLNVHQTDVSGPAIAIRMLLDELF